MINKLKNYLAEMIFPARCVWCERLGEFVCFACEEKILKINKQTCVFCGRIREKGATCKKCRNNHSLNGVLVYGYFKDKRLKEIVHQYKYEDLFALKIFLGRKLLDLLSREGLDFDFIAYVPLTKKRLAKRGYNQSELLAKEIALTSKKEVVRVLKKTRETKTQVGLKRRERGLNLSDAFEVIKKQDIENKRIIIVDDVITTGSTLEECAKVLKKSGAKKVWGLTIAKE